MIASALSLCNVQFHSSHRLLSQIWGYGYVYAVADQPFCCIFKIQLNSTGALCNSYEPKCYEGSIGMNNLIGRHCDCVGIALELLRQKAVRSPDHSLRHLKCVPDAFYATLTQKNVLC
jgi:hypothetical protein